ncbi:MAG: OmpH family outer membrane protein [Bacteroidales bacterium]|jgi:outer membrane protein|nr:OmpH family outer membrane protein [Bacteroidales bacterium]
MKKIILFLLIALFSLAGYAQRFAYVDTEYILSNIPAYKAAQEKLDQLSTEWQKEIEAQYEEIDVLYKKFKNEKVLLTDEMKKQRQEEINTYENQTKELQNKYFGREGSLFKKRQDLIKPIQNEIFSAVKNIAKNENYSVIFDSNGTNMLYSDPKYDKSDDVLEKLGYK